MKTKLLLLALLTVGFAQSQNLIQNGGFESFTSNVPDSWNIFYGTAVVENTIVNNGASSLKATAVKTESMSPAFGLKQEFNLSDPDTYILSFDYFVPNTGLPPMFNVSNLSYEIKKTSGNALLLAPQAPLVSIQYGAWKTITYEFKIAKSVDETMTATMSVNFVASTTMGENVILYFDNVVIAKKSTLGTADFNKKSAPIVVVSKNEIKLNNEYKDSSYAIYSIDGKAVKRGKNNSSDIIEISDLKKGVYLLKLSDASSSVKFIKQ